MKTFKLTYFILGTGIFMLIFCILSGASIAAKYSEINGLYRTNKVSVNLLENKGLKGNGAFTRDDIRHLQEFSFKNIDMTYAAEDKALVAYENNQTQVNVFGISDKYNMFHEIKMKSGSFITSGNKNEMVAVVDEKLAIALFNNTNVVGLYIELYNQRFKIIGVVEPDESIIQALTDNGYGSIYIPVELKEVYDANSRITCLELRAADMGTTGKNINSMKDALGSIGKNASDYKIIDYNVERILVEESAWISIFIPGVIIMVLLLLSIKTKALELYNSINSTLKEQYFKDVLKLKVVKLSLILLEILVTLVFVYLIWKTIRFNIYIPPEYIPGDLIDRTFFSEVFERLIQKSMLNTGYVPTLWEMRLNILSVMQSWNLYIYIFAGLPLYYLGLKLLGLGKGDITKKILYCCIYMVFSIIL
ncbi:MAG TPA: ABC transporter permease, partial [Patescibacteria group bacterium]|nr:ABC transporter permease [Patescibacteria group bacterium]